MRYSLFILCTLILFVTACKDNSKVADTDQSTAKSDDFYHYSIWTALVNKIYDGNLTVKEAKKKGDIGLGTFNTADGELIMLNGVIYHVPYDGRVLLADDTLRIPYLNATFFDKEFSFEFNEKIGYDSLRKLIQQKFPSRNFFYSFKIHAEFDSLKLGSLYAQERPYKYGLDSLMPNRPKFDYRNIAGTMVGFYCPEFIGDINVAGFHLHFISDDEKRGGHVMEFSGKDFKVEIDKMASYHFVLPETAEYDSVNLEKKFQYGKK